MDQTAASPTTTPPGATPAAASAASSIVGHRMAALSASLTAASGVQREAALVKKRLEKAVSAAKREKPKEKFGDHDKLPEALDVSKEPSLDEKYAALKEENAQALASEKAIFDELGALLQEAYHALPSGAVADLSGLDKARQNVAKAAGLVEKVFSGATAGKRASRAFVKIARAEAVRLAAAGGAESLYRASSLLRSSEGAYGMSKYRTARMIERRKGDVVGPVEFMAGMFGAFYFSACCVKLGLIALSMTAMLWGSGAAASVLKRKRNLRVDKTLERIETRKNRSNSALDLSKDVQEELKSSFPQPGGLAQTLVGMIGTRLESVLSDLQDEAKTLSVSDGRNMSREVGRSARDAGLGEIEQDWARSAFNATFGIRMGLTEFTEKLADEGLFESPAWDGDWSWRSAAPKLVAEGIYSQGEVVNAERAVCAEWYDGKRTQSIADVRSLTQLSTHDGLRRAYLECFLWLHSEPQHATRHCEHYALSFQKAETGRLPGELAAVDWERDSFGNATAALEALGSVDPTFVRDWGKYSSDMAQTPASHLPLPETDGALAKGYARMLEHGGRAMGFESWKSFGFDAERLLAESAKLPKALSEAASAVKWELFWQAASRGTSLSDAFFEGAEGLFGKEFPARAVADFMSRCPAFADGQFPIKVRHVADLQALADLATGDGARDALNVIGKYRDLFGSRSKAHRIYPEDLALSAQDATLPLVMDLVWEFASRGDCTDRHLSFREFAQDPSIRSCAFNLKDIREAFRIADASGVKLFGYYATSNDIASVDEFVRNPMWRRALAAVSQIPKANRGQLSPLVIASQMRRSGCDSEAYADAFIRLYTSIVPEVRRVAGDLARMLSDGPESMGKIAQIEAALSDANAPEILKIWEIFRILHPDEKLRHGGVKSPVLEKLRERSPGAMWRVVWRDLLRCRIESGDPDTVDALQSLADSRRPGGLQDERAMAVAAFFRRQADGSAAVPEEGPAFVDWLEANILVPCGYDTVDRALGVARSAKNLANERNAAQGELDAVLPGDFVKGVDPQYLGSILSSGSYAKEFLGSAADSDATPLDTDMAKADDRGIRSDAVALASRYGGSVLVIGGSDPRLSDKPGAQAFDPGSYELFKGAVQGATHWSVRTGIPSTMIRALLLADSRADKGKVAWDTAEAGLYAPIYDAEGKLVSGKAQYDELRAVATCLDVESVRERLLPGWDKVAEFVAKNCTAQEAVTAVGTSPAFARLLRGSAGVGEGYTLGQHVGHALARLEKYRQFHGAEIPGAFGRGAFAIALALHDMGKGYSLLKTGDAKRQHEFGRPVADAFLRAARVPDSIRKAIVAVIEDDLMGDGLLGLVDEAEFERRFHAKAAAAGDLVTSRDLFSLLLAYYCCDAGAYTKDAGAKESLDHVFRNEGDGTWIRSQEKVDALRKACLGGPRIITAVGDARAGNASVQAEISISA